MKNFVKDQHEYFNTGETLDYTFRMNQLKKLREVIKENEENIVEAVQKDLGKPELETYTSEILMIYDELNYMIKNLKSLMKPKKVGTPLMHFYSKSEIIPEPLGSVLVISPWNYPVSLAITPIVGAIAAGNTVVLKPSEVSSNTGELLEAILSENFDPNFISVVQGDGDTTQELIHQNFDHVFFTGSTRVGREVMKTAAEYLTPVTLELGGKSPAIVTKDADLVKAAARIVWGKAINGGQTCIAPDYVLVDKQVKNKLVRLIQEVIVRLYGREMLYNRDYPQMIHSDHFKNLEKLMEDQTILHGGRTDERLRKIELTLLDEPDLDSPVMQEEIFGPILPIISYQEFDEVIDIVRDRSKPLALYLFTESKQLKDFVKGNLSFGSGAINDTLIQYANSNLPFGGVGGSGMGQYHGKYSFDRFSNEKSVTEKTTLFDLPFRYAPYEDYKVELLKKYIRFTTR